MCVLISVEFPIPLLNDRLTMVLNGLIRVSTPYAPPPLNNTVAYFTPGTLSSSMLVAADTKETSYVAGHYTEFPSSEKTVLVQLPFAEDIAPGYVVLYDGPCED